MKKDKIRRLAFAVGTALLLTAFAVLSACFLLRHLGALIRLLPVGEDVKEILAPIFDQLVSARLAQKCVIPFLLLLLPSLLFWFCLPKGKAKPFVFVPYLLLALLLLLLAFLFAVLFSKVNGVRLFDVLRSLLRLISNGLLDRM